MVSERRGNQVNFHKGLPAEPEQKKQKPAPEVVDYSDPSAISNLLDGLDSGTYGSVTKDIESLCAQNMQMLGVYYAAYPPLFNRHLDMEKCRYQETLRLANENVVDSDGTHDPSSTPSKSKHIVVLDSDDEDSGCQRLPLTYQEVVLNKPGSEFPTNDTVLMDGERSKPKIKKENISSEVIERDHNKGVYVGVEDDIEMVEHSPGTNAEDDGLADIWKEMSFALECSKDTVADASFDESTKQSKGDCDHSFVLKDDIGYVCRICGVIDRGIDTIIEYVKNSRPRAYRSEHRSARDGQSTHLTGGLNLNGHGVTFTDICAHPRHMKQMKPHQIEGFNFLLSNLVCDNPGGCILAHAPGSGKTFMIISFMQSFLAKYPFAKPLVVLPKGILSTWKKEFQRWQIEDMPLLDFYSVKADGRSQQLEVLQKWVEQKSILFLGYKQFSTIVCSNETSKAAASCEEILLKAPSILILDEGHTPRNENTDVLQSLAKVQTPRKVVLSGTLYQNHVKEVFNILNLVRPRFLKTESSRAIVKRILSRVQITGIRKQVKSGVDAAFYDVVEHTLQKEEDFKRKVRVIQDLREMTCGVLHYYKGDFLDELPGLVDFTVLLSPSARQRSEVGRLKKFDRRKFKASSAGSAFYLHPQLLYFSDNSATDATVDEMLEKLDTRDGVKAKFYLNLLGLCASAGEKLLVFSQYLLPLKFLERLTVKTRGWSLRREIFVISGESSSDDREWSMDRFNNSPDARVFFGSIKACGEGISLVGASRILILDVHLNPSVTRQAIGRAFRPGQKNKVYVYRLIAADSLEQDDHVTCFKKELISKMWFEWNEYCGYQHFEMDTIGAVDSGDPFLESPFLREDVRLLYRR